MCHKTYWQLQHINIEVGLHNYFIQPYIFDSETWGQSIFNLECSTTLVAQLQIPHASLFCQHVFHTTFRLLLGASSLGCIIFFTLSQFPLFPWNGHPLHENGQAHRLLGFFTQHKFKFGHFCHCVHCGIITKLCQAQVVTPILTINAHIVFEILI